jgi:hypothetical protein
VEAISSGFGSKLVSVNDEAGPVIKQLMAENDMPNKDLKIGRLRPEGLSQAATMTEDEMVALVMEYNARCHEATTRLERTERELAEYKVRVESENRASTAAVDEARLRVALMEGRDEIMTRYWSDWREVGKLREHVYAIDEKINMLAEQVRHLVRQKEGTEAAIKTPRD